MPKNVITIPATMNEFTAAPIYAKEKRKVAGYARVSTDREEQQTSYEAQVNYYTDFIQSHDDWEFAGIYTDEGISATSMKHRSGFLSMIDDAMAGKIDLIVTKSVSRFARNTVDSLATIRKLKENGVEVYFEKESVWTFDTKGELMITILSSLAQEESRSISENVKWGMRKSFAEGKVHVPYKRFLGYDKGADGNLVINEEQAKTVRLIYGLYMSGLSSSAICRELKRRNIPTVTGRDKWCPKTIDNILTSEKMKGDALLQKTYNIDFLTKKNVKNQGQVPQYYIKENHEAIIDPELFDLVQAEMADRRRKYGRYMGVSIFSGKIRCGDCGCWFGPKVWHSNDKYRRIVWQCNDKFKKQCTSTHLTEDEIKAAFIKAFNIIFQSKNEIIGNIKMLQQEFCSIDRLEALRDKLAGELHMLTQMAEQAIQENATVVQDQSAYQKKYDEMMKKYDDTKQRYEGITAQIEQLKAKKCQMKNYLQDFSRQEGVISTFDESLWASLVDCLTVRKKGECIEVTFRDGTTIKVD